MICKTPAFAVWFIELQIYGWSRWLSTSLSPMIMSLHVRLVGRCCASARTILENLYFSRYSKTWTI